MSDTTLPPENDGGDEPAEMTLRASEAFQAYYDMGPNRSLRKLAELGEHSLASLERWSAAYGWQQLARERHQEESAAARSAARREAASLARRRLRNAQLLQEAGLTILARAKIAEMEEDSARSLLADARQMMVEGMRAERLELGEATENVRTLPPPKPMSDMSDDELDDYIALLEQQEG